jgi:DNA transposition AAA+ family ATPase
MMPAPVARMVETQTANIIRERVAAAIRSADPIAILGPSGIGKTTVLAAIARGQAGARFVTVQPALNSMFNVLSMIADAFGAAVMKRYPGELADILSYHMPDAVERGDFLILDEVQTMPANVLRQVLTLNDLFRLPIILAGNEYALKRTRANAAAFDQIDSRTDKLHLSGSSEADVQAFCIDRNVEGCDAFELAARFGLQRSLRELVKMLDEARRFAGPTGSLRRGHIFDALSSLLGTRDAEALSHSRN